jgi:hypothetical protein
LAHPHQGDPILERGRPLIGFGRGPETRPDGRPAAPLAGWRESRRSDLQRDRRAAPEPLRTRCETHAHRDGIGLRHLFLEDVYTTLERTLIDAGRFDTVRENRNAFQDTMREAFSAAVEEAVGRKVIGFLSQVHVDPDLSIETFILEPDGTPQAAAEG